MIVYEMSVDSRSCCGCVSENVRFKDGGFQENQAKRRMSSSSMTW